jgi:hypothetical protein
MPGDCSIYLDHLNKNICSSDQEIYDYLIKWMARGVQQPSSPGEVAVVLRGGRGVGKGKMATIYGALFGRHFLHVSNSMHLVGNFNSHLRDCCVVFADEAFFAGDKKHKSVLNTLITERSIVIEAKGIDAEAFPNYIHLIMASNDDYVIPAGMDERRYLVLNVGEGKKQDSGYFAAMNAQMESGGYSALLDYLMSIDLNGVNIRAVPATEALTTQKTFSFSAEEEWWFGRLLDGKIVRNGEVEDWPKTIRVEDLIRDYLDYKKHAPGIRRVRRVGEWSEIDEHGLVRSVHGRTYWWDLPSLEACRKAWDKQMPTQWDCDEERDLI